VTPIFVFCFQLVSKNSFFKTQKERGVFFLLEKTKNESQRAHISNEIQNVTIQLITVNPNAFSTHKSYGNTVGIHEALHGVSKT
jgi:hypothetical protein